MSTVISESLPDSSSTTSRPWTRRLLLILGVVLLGISLRSAVTGMSPLLVFIQDDLGMGNAAATVLGMLPTIAFGVAGFGAAAMMRRATPEATAVLAMILAAIGLLGRALVDDHVSFLILSAVALLGMGMGNVVGAPLVKKNFAENPAPMLTLFALLMQAGATIPAMASMPLAEAGGGWRFSVGSWALLSVAAAVPWIIQWRRVVGSARMPPRSTLTGRTRPPLVSVP